jgi:choline dehydrogenase-like flavoprotein
VQQIPTRADVIVVGAGIMGAAAAWALSVRGHAVVVLEARRAGHREGSSHGSARVFHFARRERADDSIALHDQEPAVYALPGGRDGGVLGNMRVGEHDPGGVTTADGRVQLPVHVDRRP